VQTRLNVHFFAVLVLAACNSVTGFSGIPLSNIKSPIVVRQWEREGYGSSLGTADYDKLASIAPPSPTDQSARNEVDDFCDFHGGSEDTLAVVNISLYAFYIVRQLQQQRPRWEASADLFKSTPRTTRPRSRI